MKSLWVEDRFAYTGEQLRPLYAYLEHKLLGDSIVAWRGPCNIPNEHMVDGEDLLQGALIQGSDMLHFVVEKFDRGLYAAVCLQRLLATLMKDTLEELGELKMPLRRDGDDLYYSDGKLSISVATQGPTSSLIHLAVNISNLGTPVRTASLEDLGVDVVFLAKAVMDSFCREEKSIVEATQKVISR